MRKMLKISAQWLIDIIAVKVYRILELIDGEKGLKIVPYKVAQPIKMTALMFLEGGLR